MATYGWFEEGHGLPRKFFVSIENRAPEIFRQQDAAKFFYDQSIVPLKEAIYVNGTSNGHKHKRFIANCKHCKRDRT